MGFESVGSHLVSHYTTYYTIYLNTYGRNIKTNDFYVFLIYKTKITDTEHNTT